MLDDISLYWFTDTAALSARIYWENIHDDIDLAKISDRGGGRTPLLLLRYVKLKRVCHRTNLPRRLVRRSKVGCDHLRAAFCQCQRNRLADALAGAGDQGDSSLVCF